ncbi:MAG: hypothetical protein ACFNJQ_03885 [Scardovia wiggsiae]
MQPGYAADRSSLLVVKHADIKSKLWKTAAMVFISACFTTTGRGADSLHGVIKRIPRAERRLHEEAAAIIRGKETAGTGIRAAVRIRYMKQRYKNAEL